MTTAFERIRDTWVPNWLKGFELKSRDYNSIQTGWEPHEVLGVKGQFADLWRKVGKLKKALWDDETLEGEQPLEIIDDLISHLFLTRDLMVRESSPFLSPQEQMPLADSGRCGPNCSVKRHTFAGACRYRLAAEVELDGPR